MCRFTIHEGVFTTYFIRGFSIPLQVLVFSTVTQIYKFLKFASIVDLFFYLY